MSCVYSSANKSPTQSMNVIVAYTVEAISDHFSNNL